MAAITGMHSQIIWAFNNQGSTTAEVNFGAQPTFAQISLGQADGGGLLNSGIRGFRTRPTPNGPEVPAMGGVARRVIRCSTRSRQQRRCCPTYVSRTEELTTALEADDRDVVSASSQPHVSLEHHMDLASHLVAVDTGAVSVEYVSE